MEINLQVVIPVFEGPLDLLLHLLEKNEVDIYDIPIHTITSQFIDYIENNAAWSLETTSEFVVMASHLLEIKSKMLLPIHDDDDFDDEMIGEDDPRYALVQRLLEYKRYKEVAQRLSEHHEQWRGLAFCQSNELKRYQRFIDKDDTACADIQLLVDALNAIIMRIPEVDQTRKHYFDRLKRDVYTVEQKLDELQLKFESKTRWRFDELVANAKSRNELVTIFLALLELLKIVDITVQQSANYDTIVLERE